MIKPTTLLIAAMSGAIAMLTQIGEAKAERRLALVVGNSNYRVGGISLSNHVTGGTPVATIPRPARTPKGTEVRTVVKHVTKRLRAALAEHPYRVARR